MAGIIRRHPSVHLVPRGDPFLTLARAIVGQQISTKAAQSVWNRFSGLAIEVSPDRVIRLKKPSMRGCGLSVRKCEYIYDLAHRFASGQVHVQRWPRMSDDDIIAELTSIKGIGRWTAEMFLIFHLGRPDVLSTGDLGIRKGFQLAYGLDEMPTETELAEIGQTWSPHRTIACLYFWRSLDNAPA